MHIEGGRFVVTGGASLIGSHLTQQLLETGAAAVILFDNYALGSPEVAASLAQDRRVTPVRGDITRLPELLDALDQVDGVFALAGFLTLPLSQNPGLGLEVNVLGMYNIVEACRYRGVKKVVFASSVATYGDPEADEVDERTPFSWQTVPPAPALYAASKIIGENLLHLYHQRYGLDYVALRYATVYGERQHHRGVNALHIIASYERITAGLPDGGISSAGPQKNIFRARRRQVGEIHRIADQRHIPRRRSAEHVRAGDCLDIDACC